MTGIRLRPALHRILLLLVLQLPLGWLASSSADAATFTVNTTGDPSPTASMCTGSNPCSLRAAVRLANSSPTTPDTITLPAGTYELLLGGPDENAASTGDLDITSPITINGAGSGSTFIDGNAADRVFHVLSGGDLELTSLTVQNGAVSGGVGGGIYNQDGTVTLNGVTVTNNLANNVSSSNGGGDGGGIYNAGTMKLTNCTISDNTADTSLSAGGGGGIYNLSDLTVTNCTFDGNRVTVGGVDANTIDPLSPAATPGGGALQNVGITGIGSNIGTSTIHGSTFTNNSGPLGGAIRNLFGAVNLDDSLLDGNLATLEGGGIENTGDSTATILTTAIRNNVAKQNGGGANNLGDMKITNSAIYGNSAPGIPLPGGGGAFQGGVGGGVFNGGNGVLTVVSTTISENSAILAGGLYNHKEAGLTNATIFDNTASSTTITPNGSQVFACGNKDETLGTDCSTNINDTSGAQIIHTKFVNTLIGNGTPGSRTNDNCGGDVTDLITSQGHNLETGNTCNFGGSGDLRNADPGFNSTLTYNGGGRIELLTYALASSSAAHNTADKSSCPETDERGFKRFETPSDGCDIGAYEISSTIATSVLDLALDIQYKNGDPQSGAVQTTINFTVANTSSVTATNVVLTIKVPTLSWLNVTSLGAESASGSCSRNADGVICTLPSLPPFKSSNFFVATTASQAGAFTVDGDVKSDGADNFRPDNQKSVTITIPTVAGSSGGSNNFGGSGGGGALDWLSLSVLLVPALKRRASR